MKESQLYQPLIKGAVQDGWHLYRISDLGAGRKPFDLGGVAPDGRAVGVEVKLLKINIEHLYDTPWHTIETRFLETSQVGWLRAVHEVGGYGLLVLVAHHLAWAGVFNPPIRGQESTALKHLMRDCLHRAETGTYTGWNRLRPHPG